MEDDPKIASLMDIAQKVEGLMRNAGIHAAGVIISDRPLVEHAPLYKGKDGENVVQYDMKNSEKIGLIKFDFLGLKTLTHINHGLKLVKENRNKDIKTTDISLYDKGIYAIMSRGDTAGIFQFEGDGISDLIRKVQPDRFEDITAINALYRPGPMEQLDEYVGRKLGRIKVKYLFDELEEILKETYGITVYQEQVQLIAARIGNYSLGEADLLRRAMGKKIPEEMAKQRQRFLKGAKENNHDPKKAEELFDLMEKFAGYGFNKSHAAAYCVVAAQTAWLKAYYPVEFFAALLSTEISDTDKVVKYVKDARNHGIEVRAPHVNFSEHKFSVSGDTIFFGLGAIKGVGLSAVEAIIEAREAIPEKKFESIGDFFTKIDLRRVNKKVVECLISSGALDNFGANRAQLAATYETFMERAEKDKRDLDVGQGSLFSLVEEESDEIELPKLDDWGKTQRLAKEKEVLGFYLSDHPLSGMEGILAPFISCSIDRLEGIDHKKKVVIGGLIASVREMITRKGTRMAFAVLEDMGGSVELLVFPDAFDGYGQWLSSEQPLLVEGVHEREEADSKIRVEKISPLATKLQDAKTLVMSVDEGLVGKLEGIKEVLAKYPGKTKTSLRVKVPTEQRDVYMDITDPKGVEIHAEFLESLHGKVGRTDFIHIQS
jgi:DNA polymerase-3 subunit alpha